MTRQNLYSDAWDGGDEEARTRHRAALARRAGAEMIDADVTELIARARLRPHMLEVVLRELERIFLEDSGLAEARPGMRVSVSRPAHYLELLENIQVHGYHMMRGRGRVLENAEIAADWHDAIYEPTLAAIGRLRLTRLCRDAPPGDLFTSSSTGTGAMRSRRPAARTLRRRWSR